MNPPERVSYAGREGRFCTASNAASIEAGRAEGGSRHRQYRGDAVSDGHQRLVHLRVLEDVAGDS
ncbi:MAG: hypothetical protein JXB06_02115 [Spirochaetales bacterium]|nr:hypothetical protein [Spirochaetales bacterium]